VKRAFCPRASLSRTLVFPGSWATGVFDETADTVVTSHAYTVGGFAVPTP